MTLTKEWLLNTIAELEEERDAVPGVVNKDAAMALAAMKIALASLEAKSSTDDVSDAELNAALLLHRLKVDGHSQLSDAFRAGFKYARRTATPAPVSVPETLPCPVLLEPGMRFGKGVRTQTMLDALQRRSEYFAELEAMTTEQRTERDAGIKEFAAMLQGAGHVTTTYKLRDAVETIRNSGIAIDAEKIFAERDALNASDCWCHTCRPVTIPDMRFVVCPECGNKRCPHANDHRNACTGSNEPGQEGSAYPAAPKQEVK